MNKQDQWIKNKHPFLHILPDEWKIAEAIVQSLFSHEKTRYGIIHRKDVAPIFPRLNHSFVYNQNENGEIKIGFISRSKPFDNNIHQEGIIGHGTHGVLKHVLWDSGEVDVIKIEEGKENKEEVEVLKQLGYLKHQEIKQNNKKSSWINGKFLRGKKYTVQKKIEGEPLNEFLKTNTLTDHERAQLALAVIKCIEELHSKNIIHGDIKPANLMVEVVDGNYIVHSVDFGQSVKLFGGETYKLQSKRTTRTFMTPEVGEYDWYQGKWISQNGIFSKASDVYSIGKLLDISLGLKKPPFPEIIGRLTSEAVANRPSITEARHQMQNSINQRQDVNIVPQNNLTTVSPAQALLMLINKYRNFPNLTNTFKKLYFEGISSPEDRKIFSAYKHDPLFNDYYVSETPIVINEDPTRRYFETHFCFETMQDQLKNVSTDMLSKHFDATKELFRKLGGDINKKQFQTRGKRIIVRDYNTEINERKKLGLPQEDMVYGISKEEQKKLDLVLSGSRDPSLVGLAEEYSDIIYRLKNNKNLNNLEKTNAIYLIKTTFLNMYLSQKINKYQDRYQGETIPGEHIYGGGIYDEKNRGRQLDTSADINAHSHHLGLIKPDMPLDENDKAYTEDNFKFQKPSDRNTYVAGAEWTDQAFSKLVHPFSNAISGTLLSQLKSMALQLKQGKLVLNTKEKLEQYLSLMITTMISISGGHSLYEFAVPIFLTEVKKLFKGIIGFDQIDMHSLFLKANQNAFDRALAKTSIYNAKYLDMQSNKERVLNANDNEQFKLHHAISSANISLVQSMLQENVNFLEKNEQGKTPLEVAVDCKNPILILNLLNKMAKSNRVAYRKHMADFFSKNIEYKRLYGQYQTKIGDVKYDLADLAKKITSVIENISELSGKSVFEKINNFDKLKEKFSTLQVSYNEILNSIKDINKSFGYVNFNNHQSPVYAQARSLDYLRCAFDRLTPYFNRSYPIIQDDTVLISKRLISDAAKWGQFNNKQLPNILSINQHDIIGSQLNDKLLPRDLEKQDYTFMQPNAIYQSPAMISLLQKATDNNALSLVSYKPERALLHEIAAFTTTMLNIDNENDKLKLINDWADELRYSADIKLKNSYNQIQNAALKEVEDVIKGKKQSNKISNLLKKFKFLELPASDCTDITRNQAIAELLTIEKYNQVQKKIIEKLVQNSFDTDPSKNNLKRTIMTSNTAPYYCVAGGQASGKGYQIDEIRKDINQNSKNMHDSGYVYLNNDAFKPILANRHQFHYLHSQLTHPEATVIRQRALELAKKHHIPVIMDQVNLSQSVINNALRSNHAVKGFVVSTDVLTAIERAFQRGKETGRFEDTRGILSGHKYSVETTFKTLKAYAGKNVVVNFVDNNQDGKSPVKFMTINCLNYTIEVQDMDLLRAYLEKNFINIDATTKDNVYPKKEDLNKNIDALIHQIQQEFASAGFTIDISAQHKPATKQIYPNYGFNNYNNQIDIDTKMKAGHQCPANILVPQHKPKLLAF